MVLAPVEVQRLREVHHLAVHARAEALPVELVEQLLELALAPANHRRHHGDALAHAEFENALDDLVGALARDGAAAVGAVGRADRSIEEAQVVVDLGNGADGRARAAAGGLLLDGDGRAKSLDRIHIGPLDLVEKLARVGREGLDVAPLALGVNRVEGKRTLARAGEARDHRERIARDAHVDVAQIVLARPAHRNVSDGHDENRNLFPILRILSTPATKTCRWGLGLRRVGSRLRACCGCRRRKQESPCACNRRSKRSWIRWHRILRAQTRCPGGCRRRRAGWRFGRRRTSSSSCRLQSNRIRTLLSDRRFWHG